MMNYLGKTIQRSLTRPFQREEIEATWPDPIRIFERHCIYYCNTWNLINPTILSAQIIILPKTIGKKAKTWAPS
jgi:hypothetical protein